MIRRNIHEFIKFFALFATEIYLGLSVYRRLYSYTKRLYEIFTILVAVPAIYHQNSVKICSCSFRPNPTSRKSPHEITNFVQVVSIPTELGHIKQNLRSY